MDAAALARQDLNLLVALHVLLHERHVSRAAARLGVSQPAMSRALKRLRELFDDPLLVRGSAGMQPTSRALELGPKLAGLLAGVRDLLQPAAFDPRTATASIRIAAPESLAYRLLPGLLRTLADEAPGVELDLVPSLADGAIDLRVGPPPAAAPLHGCPLLDSGWACVVRERHPALRDEWTLEQFAGLDHVDDPLADPCTRELDAALAERGLVRRVALRVACSALAPLLVAETDLVLTTADWSARLLARRVGLAVRPVPGVTSRFRAVMTWPPRCDRDPLHAWFRGLLRAQAKELDSSISSSSSR
jgi:DNA-binding transcriptional LysR family regulator